MRAIHLGGLTLIAGAAVLVTVASGGVSRAHAPTPTDAGGAPVLVGRGAPASPANGAASTGVPSGDLRDGLESRLGARRVEALEQVARKGVEAAGLRPLVEALVADADPRTALWAKTALLKLGGPASLRADICRAALESPGWDDAERALVSVAPDVAQALLAAGAVRRERARQGGALAGLDAVLDGWTKSGRPDPAELARGLATATGEDLLAWLRIARGLAPVPYGVLRVLAQRLADATVPDAAAIARFFSAGPDLSRADEDVERALLARAVGSAPGSAGPWLLALARLPRLSDEARRAIAALGERSPEDAQDVVVALRARG